MGRGHARRSSSKLSAAAVPATNLVARVPQAFRMLLAFTRPVPPTIADCELTHLAREPINWARAVEQHEQYEDALRDIGCTVERLAGDPSQPDSVFIEDTAVVVDGGAVVTPPR